LLDFKIWRPRFAEKHMKTFLQVTPKKVLMIFVGENLQAKVAQKLFNFSRSLEKYGQKSFASPKLCLLLNL